MARNAKQILMEQGYTEAEVTPMLNDQRMVKMLEAEEAARDRLNSELTDMRGVLKRTEDWYNGTALPTIEQANRNTVAAHAKAAQLEEQLKREAELGLRRVAQQDGGAGAGASSNSAPAGTPNNAPTATTLDERYVSTDTFRQTADQFGTAIAMAQDIADDHQELFGKRIPGGVTKLRDDFMQARKEGFQGNMAQFADKQFGFTTKRQELAAKARADEITAARADERQKVTSEMLNPNTAPMSTSRNPFVKQRVQGGTTEGANQPWDTSPERRASARVSKFAAQVLNGKTA
jgi:hypothetical protein